MGPIGLRGRATKFLINMDSNIGPNRAAAHSIGFRLAPLPPSDDRPLRHDRYLIAEALEQSPNAIGYWVSQWLHDAFPGRALIEGSHWRFDLDRFSEAGQCAVTPRPSLHAQILTEWDEEDGELGKVSASTRQAWFAVSWEGQNLDVLVLHWADGRCLKQHVFILAGTAAVATRFLQAVCAWNAIVREEVMVFDGDEWRKDEKLYRAIKGAQFDSLVLAGTQREEIRTDAHRFFAAERLYRRYGVPWKRGILFYGPPGNGKTHAVKALVNDLGKPCLYVQSFRNSCGPDEESIAAVFDQARKSAPCVLVFEDLDALITKRNRSFFLNELDGFAGNDGILSLATSNHPEKLDPAIVNRPSRFDRKYEFGLPGLSERLLFLGQWSRSLEPGMRLSPAGLHGAAEATGGFSYAYLKELCLTALMRWIDLPQRRSDNAMDGVMQEAAVLLAGQITPGKKAGGKSAAARDQMEAGAR
jgi:hypothetical protein